MSVKATSLVTLADAKAYCKVTTATYDTVLEMLIDAVSDLFSRYVGRRLDMTTYTGALFDGRGKEYIALPAHPIVAVTSVDEDDAELVEGADEDYIVYEAEGLLRRVGGEVWLDEPQSVSVTYTAGYVVQGATPGVGETALPADLKLACLMQVAREWKRHQQGDWGEMSRTMADGSISRSDKDALLPQVMEILDTYRTLKI